MFIINNPFAADLGRLLAQGEDLGWIIPVLVFIFWIGAQIKEAFDQSKKHRQQRTELEQHAHDVTPPGEVPVRRQHQRDDMVGRESQIAQDQDEAMRRIELRREQALKERLARDERLRAEREQRSTLRERAEPKAEQARNVPEQAQGVPERDQPSSREEVRRRLESSMGLPPGTLSQGDAAPTPPQRIKRRPQVKKPPRTPPQPAPPVPVTAPPVAPAAPLLPGRQNTRSANLASQEIGSRTKSTRPSRAAALRGMLTPATARQAILLTEILGKPKGMG